MYDIGMQLLGVRDDS